MSMNTYHNAMVFDHQHPIT